MNTKTHYLSGLNIGLLHGWASAFSLFELLLTYLDGWPHLIFFGLQFGITLWSGLKIYKTKIHYDETNTY